VGEHFKKKLVPHISDVARNQLHELQGKHVRVPLTEAISRAFDGACFIFEAREMIAPKDIHLVLGNLDDYWLDKLPFAAVVVLEEWFFNCITEIYGYRRANAVIAVEVEGRNVCIYSPGRLDQQQIAVLTAKPLGEKSVNSHQGLPLIRNILYYAYGIKAQVEWNEQRQATKFSLRLPLTRLRRQNEVA
jgi:hypothetical protein